MVGPLADDAAVRDHHHSRPADRAARRGAGKGDEATYMLLDAACLLGLRKFSRRRGFLMATFSKVRHAKSWRRWTLPRRVDAIRRVDPDEPNHERRQRCVRRQPGCSDKVHDFRHPDRRVDDLSRVPEGARPAGARPLRQEAASKPN